MRFPTRGRITVLVLVCATGVAGCRSSTLISPGPSIENAKGTLSGAVHGPDESAPAVARLVEAVEIRTGDRFSTTTNAEGAYSFLLPPGTYRIAVTLARGEAIVKQPAPVEVEPGAVKTGVDVVLGGAGVAPDGP